MTLFLLIGSIFVLTGNVCMFIMKRDITKFYFKIKHGDVEHRKWLKEEFQSHFGFIIEDKND